MSQKIEEERMLSSLFYEALIPTSDKDMQEKDQYFSWENMKNSKFFNKASYTKRLRLITKRSFSQEYQVDSTFQKRKKKDYNSQYLQIKKKKKHMINSIDAQKLFYQIQHLF